MSTTLPYYRFEIHDISDRDYWQQVSGDPRSSVIADAVLAIAGAASDQPVVPRASEFLAAKRHNDRAKLDWHWSTPRNTFAALCVARCLDGDAGAGVDDRLLDWLWAMLTQPTWVVSAHLPRNDLPDLRKPQHDLAACEMAGALAEAAVMLRPWIENQSGTLIGTIVHEIERRVLVPFVEIKSNAWFNVDARALNNWTGVCAGTVLAACESLAELGHPQPAVKAKAADMLRRFLAYAFTPDGECDEGIGYWSYGVGFAMLGWSRLHEAEFRSLVDPDRFNRVTDYPRRAHLFDDMFFSGNDADLKAGPPAHAAAWLGAASGSQWLIDWHKPQVDLNSTRSLPTMLRTLDARLRLPDAAPRLPTPPATRFLSDQQTAIVIDDRLTVTFSGGTNAENHNHNDLGHFNVWCDGDVIVPDMGAPFYTADFFGPKRYEYITASSRGHCCPVINGHAQRAGGDAAGVVIEGDLEGRRFVIDLTSAYPKEAGLRRWTRSFSRTGPNAFVIEDAFDLPAGGTIETVVWSLHEPVIDGANVRLGPVALHFDPAMTATVDTHSSTDLKLRSAPHDLYRVTLPAIVAADQMFRVTMRIELSKKQ